MLRLQTFVWPQNSTHTPKKIANLLSTSLDFCNPDLFALMFFAEINMQLCYNMGSSLWISADDAIIKKNTQLYELVGRMRKMSCASDTEIEVNGWEHIEFKKEPWWKSFQ